MRLSHLLVRTAVAAVSLALIACADPAAPEHEPKAGAQAGETAPSPLPAATDEAPRYVGLWATTVEGCADPAWRFAAEGISTRGEVSCEFQHVRATPGGYEIDATCVAQAAPVQHNLRISFAESARAMMVSGGPWAPAPNLVYCRGL